MLQDARNVAIKARSIIPGGSPAAHGVNAVLGNIAGTAQMTGEAADQQMKEHIKSNNDLSASRAFDQIFEGIANSRLNKGPHREQ